MVARRIAEASGLEYALMSGGDVSPMGAQGVTALHALFRWARTSPTGVLIFIDEAEAFLASRSRARLSEHMRNALNAFLYQTGGPTTSFVLVLATNRADDLDDAVLDRVDETLYLGLPAADNRKALLQVYFRKYLGSLSLQASEDRMRKAQQRLPRPLRPPARLLAAARAALGPARLDIDPRIDDALFDHVAADLTEGFSGREIEKLCVAAQAIAYGSGATLDRETFLGCARHKAEEHATKDALLLIQQENEEDAAARVGVHAQPASPAHSLGADDIVHAKFVHLRNNTHFNALDDSFNDPGAPRNGASTNGHPLRGARGPRSPARRFSPRAAGQPSSSSYGASPRASRPSPRSNGSSTHYTVYEPDAASAARPYVRCDTPTSSSVSSVSPRHSEADRTAATTPSTVQEEDEEEKDSSGTDDDAQDGGREEGELDDHADDDASLDSMGTLQSA